MRPLVDSSLGVGVRQTTAVSSAPLQATGAAAIAFAVLIHHTQEAA
jgi:hypothetical protein